MESSTPGSTTAGLNHASEAICLTHANRKFDHQTLNESAHFRQEWRVLDHPGIPEKGSIPFPRVWRKRFYSFAMMRSFSFSWRLLPIFKFHLYFYLYVYGCGVDGSFFFRLPMVRRLPFKIKISFYVVVKLLILFSLSRLFMDELTRAVAQFYPEERMVGSVHHRPRPGRTIPFF